MSHRLMHDITTMRRPASCRVLTHTYVPKYGDELDLSDVSTPVRISASGAYYLSCVMYMEGPVRDDMRSVCHFCSFNMGVGAKFVIPPPITRPTIFNGRRFGQIPAWEIDQRVGRFEYFGDMIQYTEIGVHTYNKDSGYACYCEPCMDELTRCWIASEKKRPNPHNTTSFYAEGDDAEAYTWSVSQRQQKDSEHKGILGLFKKRR